MKTEDIKSAAVKFGNVSFTETGISYEVPYKEPNWDEIPHSNFKVLECIKLLVEGRLQGCINHLNANIINNIGSNKDGFIYFKDGSHFSRRAAEAMQRILNTNKLGKFDGMMLNQAIKACVNPKVVQENQVVPATYKETQLQYTIDVLMEYQVVYNSAHERAVKCGLEGEFEKALETGCTVEEALKEWDI